MSDLCGCRGFTGPSACILKRGHKGDHSYGNWDEALARNKRDEIEALRHQLESLRQQIASRDAEVAELKSRRDEAVSAVQRLSEGHPFDAVVIADTVKLRTGPLEAERDELLADALRYRWLRNGGDDDHGVGIYDPVIGDFCFTTWDFDLDAAIDAAIAKGHRND